MAVPTPYSGSSRIAAALAVVSLAILHFPAPLSAAGTGVPAVGFGEAVARALRRAVPVSVAALDLEAAKRDAEIARGHNLPRLAFEERFVRSSAPAEVFGLKMNRQKLSLDDFAAPVVRFNDPAPVNDFIASLALEQPLFAPQAMLGWRMARREAEARGKDVDRAREEAVHRVVAAWLGVLTAREFVSVADRSLEAAREHHALAGKLEAAGVGLAADGLRARVAVAEAEGAAVAARNRLELARKGLALAVGERGGASLDAEGPMPELPEPGELEARIAQALATRRDLAAAADRAGNAAANVDLHRAAYLPTVGFRAGWQQDGGSPFESDNRSWNVGVGLRWELFDGLRREASAARARIESGKAREMLRGAGDLASYEVSRAWLAVSDARARLPIARDAVVAAEEGVRLVRSRYENRIGRMIDVLDAQAALDAARAGEARAANELRQAQADLELATGTLLDWATRGAAGSAREEGR